jgi:hypothetical protein
MSALSIGEVINGLAAAKRARTFQPVRRNSYYAGDRRATGLWRRLGSNNREARRLIAARMKAAEFYDRQNKEDGKRNGPLGHIGLEVLRELYRIVDFKTGRLEPAIATICERICRSRAAVVAAMARLKEHGFLDWVRRSETIDNPGAGPQVRQITNAYGFGLPAAAAAWMKRILGNGPAPDCEIARKEADAAEVEAMLDTVDCEQQAAFVVGTEGDFAQAMASLARAVERRNSASSPSGQNPASDRI